MKLQEWTIEEQEQLIHFMTTNTWPFDGHSHPGRDIIEKAIEEGGYNSEEVKTFWVENKEDEKVGIVKIYDLQEEIPLFDLRIADEWRGHGFGSKALRLVAKYIFELEEHKIRLEGHTRQDNLAMRITFERAGFVKEAHLRNAWFSPKENSYYDAVTYGITREDYLQGTTTPVIWEDSKKKKGEVRNAKIEYPNFPEQFESERLIIRAPRISDAEVVWNATRRSLRSLREWMPWAQVEPDLEDIEHNLRQSIADFVTRKDLRLLIFEKESGAFIGSSGLHRINWAIPKFEIGYWLDTRYEGQGFMTEAVTRITSFAFEELGARRIEIRCDEDNRKSKVVAERVGFKLEGILLNDDVAADGQTIRNTCIYAKVN